MALPLEGSRPGTAEEQPVLGAFFATNVGKWYFASIEAHTAFPINVWAHERNGTLAAKCPYPSWLQRPTRALHGARNALLLAVFI